MDMELDYDILEQPPPIEEEQPQWYVNFLNSDREPAEQPTQKTPDELPATDITLPEQTPH